MSGSIGVLIVDDHALVRKGLAALLDVRPELHLVGEANGSAEAVHLACTQIPDVILMDLDMPGENGIEAIKKIKQCQQISKILVLTSFSDDKNVIAAIQAGADGYLLKTIMPEDLLRAIHEVFQGKLPLDPSITGTVVREMNRSQDPPPQNPNELTKREIVVLKLIAKGHSNQTIAELLMISDRTVSTHVSSILTKLQLENRTQAALYALRSGLADLNGDD
jgi:two-component system, NarL family, response regulator LiaR